MPFESIITCGNCGQELELCLDKQDSNEQRIVFTVNDHECFHEKKENAPISIDMVTDNELLPCPFCGEYPEIKESFGWKITCPGCKMGTPSEYEVTKAAVVNQWNLRQGGK